MNKLSQMVVVIAITLLCSCSARITDFTVISSKQTSLTFDKSTSKRVSAKSTGFLGLGADIKEAMDKCFKQAGPEYDLLVDGVVYEVDYILWSGYKVEGTAVNSSKK